MSRRGPAIFSAVVVGAMLALSAWAWVQLPADAQVPIHWGPHGEVDGYAGKTVGLFLLPLVTSGVAALFWVIPVVEPRRANLEKSGKAYAAIWIGVVLDLSWTKTHRVGGRLFVVEGLAFILLGLLRPDPELLFVVLIGGIVVMLVFVFAYSYRAWKLDPAKRAI